MWIFPSSGSAADQPRPSRDTMACPVQPQPASRGTANAVTRSTLASGNTSRPNSPACRSTAANSSRPYDLGAANSSSYRWRPSASRLGGAAVMVYAGEPLLAGISAGRRGSTRGVGVAGTRVGTEVGAIATATSVAGRVVGASVATATGSPCLGWPWRNTPASHARNSTLTKIAARRHFIGARRYSGLVEKRLRDGTRWR